MTGEGGSAGRSIRPSIPEAFLLRYNPPTRRPAMSDALMQSAAAAAVLRFEIKGWKSKDPGRRLPAYRELAAAGIMEAVPGSDTDYRFTEDGMKRREEILERE